MAKSFIRYGAQSPPCANLWMLLFMAGPAETIRQNAAPPLLQLSAGRVKYYLVAA